MFNPVVLCNLVLALAALAAGAAAPVPAPAPFELNFNVHRGSSSSNAHGAEPYVQLAKRDGTLLATLYNEQTFYMANISIGTPGQNIGVLIDTGSSDLWVMDTSNPYCSSSSSSSSYDIDDSVLAQRLQNQTFISKPFLKYSKNVNKNALHVIKKRDEEPTTTVSSLSTTLSIDDESVQQKNLFSEIASLFGGSTDGGSGSGGVIYSTYTIGAGSPTETGTSSGGSSSGSVPMDCDLYGTFSESSSSSFHSNGTSFLIRYGDDTFASGTWSYDNVQLGGTTIENLSFALANQSNSTMGVLGIGLPQLETTYSSAYTNGYTYQNLPMKLVSDGVINRNVYSVYLNTTQEANTGSVLFGAVDSSKYSGDLELIKVINTLSSSGYSSAIKLEVTLSSVSVNGGSSPISPANVRYPALLDTGTTMVYLPQSLLTLITANINGSPQYDEDLGVYTMPCSSAGDQKVSFNFTGKSIDVPLRELLLTVSSITGSSSLSSSSSSSSTCALGLIPVSSNRLILGDLFLRSAYVVYDLDNYQIGMAQAANSSSASTNSDSVQAIVSSIPGASSASAYSATYSGATSADPGTSGAAAATGRASTSSSSSSTSSGSKHNGAMPSRGGDNVIIATLSMMFIAICLSGYAIL